MAGDAVPDTSPGWSRPSQRLVTTLNVAKLAGIAMAVVWFLGLALYHISRTMAIVLLIPFLALVVLGGLWGGYVRAMRTQLVAYFTLDTAYVLERTRRALEGAGMECQGMSDDERSLVAPGVELLGVREGDSEALVGIMTKEGRTEVNISRINKETWPFVRRVSIIVMDALGGEMHRIEP